jgi:hypothetical protein
MSLHRISDNCPLPKFAGSTSNMDFEVRMLDRHIRHAFTNDVTLRVLSGGCGRLYSIHSLFIFYPPSFTLFPLLSDSLHLLGWPQCRHPVQAPQNLIRWSFSEPTMIQETRVVRHTPPLSPIQQKTRVHSTHQPSQIFDFQRYPAPPLSTWFRRTIAVLTIAASLKSRLSDGITLRYRTFRWANRKLIQQMSRTMVRSMPCGCGRVGKP